MKIDRKYIDTTILDSCPYEIKAYINYCVNASMLNDFRQKLLSKCIITFPTIKLINYRILLDIFDRNFAAAIRLRHDTNIKWPILMCDEPTYNAEREILITSLNTTTLIIQNTTDHHIYNSLNELAILLMSNNPSILNAVTQLLYALSLSENLLKQYFNDNSNMYNLIYFLAEVSILFFSN